MARLRRPIGKAARNERRKALSATRNALSVAPIVTAVFQPITTGRGVEPLGAAAAAMLFVAMQIALHSVPGNIVQ